MIMTHQVLPPLHPDAAPIKMGAQLLDTIVLITHHLQADPIPKHTPSHLYLGIYFSEIIQEIPRN